MEPSDNPGEWLASLEEKNPKKRTGGLQDAMASKYRKGH